MGKQLAWKDSGDQRDIVHLVVQGLVEGHLVILPTETTYQVVASALNEAAVGQLTELVQAGLVSDPCLLLRSAEESFDYSPGMSRVARRAVYRGWPGPLVLQLPTGVNAAQGQFVDEDVSLVNRLPEVSQSVLLTENRGGKA